MFHKFFKDEDCRKAFAVALIVATLFILCILFLKSLNETIDKQENTKKPTQEFEKCLL